MSCSGSRPFHLPRFFIPSFHIVTIHALSLILQKLLALREQCSEDHRRGHGHIAIQQRLLRGPRSQLCTNSLAALGDSITRKSLFTSPCIYWCEGLFMHKSSQCVIFCASLIYHSLLVCNIIAPCSYSTRSLGWSPMQ